MNTNAEIALDVPDNHTVCQGPCAEIFHEDDTLDVAGVRMCTDCYREHPDVVRSLYDDLRADMLSDDY